MSEDFSICKPNECAILTELEREVEARVEKHNKSAEQARDCDSKTIALMSYSYKTESLAILTIIRSKKGGA